MCIRDRITTFGDVVVFGTYATYVIMSIMMMVMVIMLLPSAQVSAGRINEVLEAEVCLLYTSITARRKPSKR